MNAQFRGKHRLGSIYVPGTDGWKLRACETSDPKIIKDMQDLVKRLRRRLQFDLLDGVIAGRISLPELYQADVDDTLDQLRVKLRAVNLVPLIEEWLAQYVADGKALSNVGHYRRAVVSLLGDPEEDDAVFLSTDLTPAAVMAWLRNMTTVTSGTRRGKLMALRSFVGHLVATGVLATNPIRDVVAPKKNPPSMRYESLAVDRALVEATVAPDLKALFAFIHATGADLSPVLAHTLRGDIDLERGVARLRGTKHAKRHVHEAIIEPWALPALRAYLETMLPTVKPWAHVTRYMAAWHHTAPATAAGATGYTLRMARHSVAVRARKAGRSFEWIAAQLGNSVYQVATVYAAFHLTTDERLTPDAAPEASGPPSVGATDSATSSPTPVIPFRQRSV